MVRLCVPSGAAGYLISTTNAKQALKQRQEYDRAWWELAPASFEERGSDSRHFARERPTSHRLWEQHRLPCSVHEGVPGTRSRSRVYTCTVYCVRICDELTASASTSRPTASPIARGNGTHTTPTRDTPPSRDRARAGERRSSAPAPRTAAMRRPPVAAGGCGGGRIPSLCP